jgi:hypothetical protein
MQSGIPAAAISAAEFAAPGILGFIIGRWSGQIADNSYSKYSRSQLSALITIFKKSISANDYPLLWKLDSNNRPERFFRGDDFRSYVEPNFRNPSRQNFSHQSRMITENIAAYLNQRKKRWVGKGTPGDLLEQFLGEWFEWATNSLPYMGYDTTALETLQKRLDYIDKVIGDPFILPYSRLPIPRTNNKYVCFNIIRDNIESCLSLAEQEKIRVSATEKFEDLRTNIAQMLQDCLHIIYYTRGTVVADKPFDIVAFAKTADHSVKSSPSGKMLNETIHKAGVAAFILSRVPLEDKCENRYFKDDKSAKVVDWLDSKNNSNADLPVWVRNNNDIQESLQYLQNLCAAILQYAEIKNLIEVARDLSSQSGNVWAYADKTGKHAIVAVEFLHKAALKNLTDTIQLLLNQQNKLRGSYIQQQRKKDAGAENYLKLEEIHEKIKRYYEQLTKTMSDIRVQLDAFPIESEAQINELKQIFYTSINTAFNKSHPDKAQAYLLDIPRIERNEVAEKVEPTLFDFPLVDTNKDEVRYETPELQDYSFTKPAPEIDITWQLGGNYETWTRDFFINNIGFLTRYAQQVISFQAALTNKAPNDIISCFQALNLTLESFAAKINDERPKWRLLPLTLGYPFNAKARHFTKLILAEVAIKRTYLQQCVQQTVPPAAVESAPPGSTDKLNTAQLLLSLQTLSSNAEMIERRTKESKDILQRSNSEVKYIPAPDPFFAWWTKVDANITGWIDSKYSKHLTIFSDAKNTQNTFTSLLKYRDSLPDEDSLRFVTNVTVLHQDKSLLHNVSLTLPNKKNSAQLQLVLKLLEVLITIPGSQERENKTVTFNSACYLIFPQRTHNSRIFPNSSSPAPVSVTPTSAPISAAGYRPGE